MGVIPVADKLERTELTELLTSEPVSQNDTVRFNYPSGFSYANTRVVESYITDGNARWFGTTFIDSAMDLAGVNCTQKASGSFYCGVLLYKI